LQTNSNLQIEGEQRRYYNYNTKVVNNYLASYLNSTVVNNLEFSKYSPNVFR